MQTMRYFLLSVLIFGSLKFSLAFQNNPGGLLEGVKNTITESGQFGEIHLGINLPLPSLRKEDQLVCNECDDKSLSFYTASSEQWTLRQTYNNSVEVIADELKTNGTVTGGVFGENLYKFYKFSYDWEIITWGKKVQFEIRDFFYNTKYGSFENALNYPDGLIQLYVPVNANVRNWGNTENPSFDKFKKTFQKIKKPGDTVPVFSLDSYTWFKNFPSQATYKYYRSSYFDKDNGKTYSCATTVQLPLEGKENYMSRTQFEETFGSLKDKCGKPLTNTIPPRDPPKSSMKEATGIKVLLI